MQNRQNTKAIKNEAIAGRKKLYVIVRYALSIICGLGFTATAAMALPADAPAALNNCGKCHGLGVNGTLLLPGLNMGGSNAVSGRDVAGWINTINRMNGYGAGITDVDSLAKYLAGGQATTTTLPASTTTTKPATTTTSPPNTTTTTKAPVTTTTAPPSTTTTTSPNQGESGAQLTKQYCVSCHGMTVNGVVLGTGGMFQASVTGRDQATWVSTINRMRASGCQLPATAVNEVAEYLAKLGSTTTTTTNPPASTTTTTKPATTTTAPSTTTTTSPGQSSSGNQLISQYCGTCHGLKVGNTVVAPAQGKKMQRVHAAHSTGFWNRIVRHEINRHGVSVPGGADGATAKAIAEALASIDGGKRGHHGSDRRHDD